MIEHFEAFVRPFAETLDLFAAKHTTVMTGASPTRAPLSGVHPHPIEEAKAGLLHQAFGALANHQHDGEEDRS